MPNENRIKERRDNYIELELISGDTVDLAVNGTIVARFVAPDEISFRGYIKHRTEAVTFNDPKD